MGRPGSEAGGLLSHYPTVPPFRGCCLPIMFIYENGKGEERTKGHEYGNCAGTRPRHAARPDSGA